MRRNTLLLGGYYSYLLLAACWFHNALFTVFCVCAALTLALVLFTDWSS